MLTRIDVTEKHIRMGIRNDCDSCPIALAIMEQVKKATWVSVMRRTAEMENESGDGKVLPLPSTAVDFVCSFDAWMPVRPFSFDLDIPEGF